MGTKITLVIDNPEHPDDFEPVDGDMGAAAATLPKLQRLESAKVWPKEDGTLTPSYRTLDLYFDTSGAAPAAGATPAAGELFGALIGTDAPFQGLFSEIEQP